MRNPFRRFLPPSASRKPNKVALPVFINYRRTDTSIEAEKLLRDLQRLYGDRFFLDVTSVGPGKWPEHIRNALASSQIVLSLMGDRWLDAKLKSSDTRRLDDPDDWVRAELEEALATNKLIIPVYVRDTSYLDPTALPEVIRGVLDYQAFSLRPDPLWTKDFRTLCVALESECSSLLEDKKDVPFKGSSKVVLLKGFNLNETVRNPAFDRHDPQYRAIEEFQSWINRLALYLREDYIEAIVNVEENDFQDTEAKIQDRLRCIDDADYVCVLCTPDYKKHYDERQGEAGIDAEAIGRIINRGSGRLKIIPIILKGDEYTSLPQTMGSLEYLSMQNREKFEKNIPILLDIIFGRRTLSKRNLLGISRATSGDLTPVEIPYQRAKFNERPPEVLSALYMNQVDREKQWQTYVDLRQEQWAAFLLHGGRRQSLDMFVDRINTDLGDAVASANFRPIVVRMPRDPARRPVSSEDWIRLIAMTISDQLSIAGEPLYVIKEAHYLSDLSIVIGPVQAENIFPKKPTPAEVNLQFGLLDLIGNGFCQVIQHLQSDAQPSKNKLWWTVFIECQGDNLDKQARTHIENRLYATGRKMDMPAKVLPDVKLPDWETDMVPFLKRLHVPEEKIKAFKREYRRIDSWMFNRYSELAAFAQHIEREIERL